MQLRYITAVLAASLVLWSTNALAVDAGNPETGRQLFRACIACHTLVPDRHMTGPSLAGIWGQKAGTIKGFTRYSKALKQAEIVWDENTLDAWLADPKGLIPKNRMTFRGIEDNGQRLDLIAFLHRVSEEGKTDAGQQAEATAEETMSRGQMLNLKGLESNNRITSIRLCGDTYTVMAATGEAYEFWEFNLRFKTDGSEIGPTLGHPMIIPGGMRGDRAYVVFASPAEISPFIEQRC